MRQHPIQFRQQLTNVRLIDARSSNKTRTPIQPQLKQETPKAEQKPSEPAHAFEEIFINLTEAMHELEHRRGQSLAELRMAAVELAVLVASRITYEKVNKDDYAIEALVQDMINRLTSDETVKIELNPEDLALLQSRLKEQKIEFETSSVTFSADASLARGACHATAGDLGLITTIEQSLDKLRYELMQGLDDAPTERRQTTTSDHGLQRFPERRETA